MENNTNNIQITDMDCWAVDDWAAFGISLWTLQRKIKEDPAYISEAVDVLVGLREVVPRLSLVMRVYATDVADMVAGLCCDCIRGLVDDCKWKAQNVTQVRPVTLSPDDNLNPPEDDDEDPLDLPPEWFDGLDDDDDDEDD